MTRLAERRSKLIIETDDIVRDRGKLRQVVLEPKPGYMQVRLKGTQRRLEVSHSAIWDLACKMEAIRVRAEKAAKRRTR